MHFEPALFINANRTLRLGRLSGLKPAQLRLLQRAVSLLASKEILRATLLLLDLVKSVPSHADVSFWLGHAQILHDDWEAAHTQLDIANTIRPNDCATLVLLSAACAHLGRYSKAYLWLQTALTVTTTPAEAYVISLEADKQGYFEIALPAIEKAILGKVGKDNQTAANSIDAPQAVWRLQRARCLQALGHANQAAIDYRSLINRKQLVARAWFALLDLKTVRLDSHELDLLAKTEAAEQSTEDKMLLAFALGKAYEDERQFDNAMATLQRANKFAQRTRGWDSAFFSGLAISMRETFNQPLCKASQQQGDEVIFLVGLPRSGTTLVEQIVASHSSVEGASELPYLHMVIERESHRRSQPLTSWAGTANAHDWTRLGQEYLQLSKRWRATKPIATDKLPENWIYAGAAMAMLPNARIIDCRRDRLETCWSCYKQLFALTRVGFAYDFYTLASYWHDYDVTCKFWVDNFHEQFYVQHYEALIATPEEQIRKLLAFCNLPFESACLDFYKTTRAVRTPSASQVRQPLLNVSAPAAQYGDRLSELRNMLYKTPS